jgi:hypothetical protein
VAKAALLISLIALVIAILAYQEAGGARALQENLRSVQSALELARKETADALTRLERAVRSSETQKPAGPAAPTGAR